MSEYNSWTDQTPARNNIMDISLQMSSRHTKDVKYFIQTVQINNSPQLCLHHSSWRKLIHSLTNHLSNEVWVQVRSAFKFIALLTWVGVNNSATNNTQSLGTHHLFSTSKLLLSLLWSKLFSRHRFCLLQVCLQAPCLQSLIKIVPLASSPGLHVSIYVPGSD